ncbi:transcriptional regulator, AraC family with amidase-like domain [Shimia gijangensis]|uniref:Transcriptional regulator, AraC family with amidase-like domain n=1 Tax=Shimia gijangensis TaxID=1470563 RepID=A0A1M6ATG6_9RHOB|nr:GlxA family transcriptional regulator [Shimia gijangensis]SHI39727.1 transcriptional regulator, AraC family with amidase-like domain [Shimia gijangensis]
MRIWSKTSAAVQHIGVLLFDGFSNHCLANTVEPLRAANTLSGRPLYDWQFLTLSGRNAESSSGLQVAPHSRLNDASGDLLAVMPSYGFQQYAGWTTQAALRASAKRFTALAGLDTGSWLLAEAGLLDGHRATIHWEELTSFEERFPEVDTARERFVIDRDRVTCSGAMAAFDLVLHMIGRDHGQALALEVSHLFMTRDSARSHAGGAGSASRVVNRALAVMQEHLEEPLPIAEVARRSGRTQKALEARMMADLGATPQQVYRRLRLNLSRKLVTETDLTVAEIALRSGYENPAAMTRAFKQEFGTTPRELRRDSH